MHTNSYTGPGLVYGPLNRTANGFPKRLPYMVCFYHLWQLCFKSRVCKIEWREQIILRQSRIASSFIVLSEKINLLFTGSVGPDGEKLCPCS